MMRQVSQAPIKWPRDGGGRFGRPAAMVRRGSALAALAGLAGALLLAGAGCSATLADGYTPRPLNASSSQRRAYYATPFTPEAENAAPEKPQGPSEHRPGAY